MPIMNFKFDWPVLSRANANLGMFEVFSSRELDDLRLAPGQERSQYMGMAGTLCTETYHACGEGSDSVHGVPPGPRLHPRHRS